MQGSSNKNYRELLTERQGKGFSEYEMMEILRQILPALAEMHSRGKAHGAISLKSLVQIDGSAKLIDVVPDQSNCAKDMLELGLVVLNLLTAKPPRLLKNDDGSWNWDDHCVVSDQLTEIVNRMLAVNPPTRFNSAVEVLIAMGLAAPQPVMYPPQTIQPIATSSQTSQKSLPNWLWAAIGAGSTLLIALAGFGAWSLVSPNPSSSVVNAPQGQTANNPNPLDTIVSSFTKPSKIEVAARQAMAKTYVGSMNRGQQAFYIEKNRFANNFDALGIGIKTETESYSYRIVIIDERKLVQVIGLAKQVDLRSYAGVVWIKELTSGDKTSLAILCGSDQPTTAMPEQPNFSTDVEPNCPTGYSKLY